LNQEISNKIKQKNRKMANQFPPSLAPHEEDIQKMLACRVHIGTKNIDVAMKRYLWKRRSDGVHLIDLQKTWEKLTLAARIIAAIENPADVCVISARTFGQRAVLKFAKYTGAHALTSRYTPGSLTNQIQDKFLEPRLIIVTDPRTDHQPVRESSYVNVPVIAFCHTNASLQYVDVAIPCNNQSRHAIGLMWWLLCREVLYLRNTQALQRSKPWDVMVDLFFYRDPEEKEEQDAAAAGKQLQQQNQQQQQAENWQATTPDWSNTTTADWGNDVVTGGSTWDSSVVASTGGNSWDAATS